MSFGGLTNISFIGMATLGYVHSNFVISAIEDIFISHYGICVLVCFEIWYKLKKSGKLFSRQTPKHLFWALMHMKIYCTQRVLCTVLKTTRPTFNKHVHHIIDIISGFAMVRVFV